jgi:hypothetical protein
MQKSNDIELIASFMEYIVSDIWDYPVGIAYLSSI